MGGNGILGGGKARGGKSRDRVEKSVVGKRRLEEKDVRWVMGGKVGVVRGLDGEQEFLTGLVEGDGGWSNGSYEIKRGGVEVDMISGERELGTFESEEELEIERLIEECGVGKEVVRLSDRKRKGVERSVGEVGRMFEKGMLEGGKKEVKRFRLVGEEVMEEEEDMEGVNSLEAWRLRKVVKERREKEERKKREKEGMVARGKEMGRSREEVKKLRREFRDWREEVEEVSYILGESEEKVRSFGLDMEVRRWGKELRELMSEVDLEGRKLAKERVEVLSKVVVLEMVEKVEKLKEKVVVGEGRSYGEVLRGVSPGMGEEEVKKLKEEKGEERKVLESSLLEKEERLRKKVEVILDTQEGLNMEVDGESEWSTGRMEEVLGLDKGGVVGMVKKKGRITVELKGESEVKKVGEEGEKLWGEMKGVKGVEGVDNWAGMIIPAMSVGRWMGKLGELREDLEEKGLKLMKEPVWLLKEDKIREWRMREVGVLVHVARESVRVKCLEEGLKWKDEVLRVYRYVGKKEVEWCTKCEEFGHSWWKCGSKVKRCSICAVKGHTGWEHRCGRCQVWRRKCVHHGSCGGCGKNHMMKEANQGNCVAWRLVLGGSFGVRYSDS